MTHQKEGLHTYQNERLFKKKTEAKSIRTTKIRHKIAKERSSSMSTLLGPSTSISSTNELYDLSRTKSFRVEGTQKIFRESDLVQGEMLGKGFFGELNNI